MKQITLAYLVLAFSLPSNGQTSQGGQIQSLGKVEGQNESLSSNSSLLAAKVTDGEVAKKRGLTLDEVRGLHTRFSFTNQEIAQIPQSKLEPALWQIRHPKLDLHAAALKFRRQMLEDEHGEIPTNAWLKAEAQRKQMHFDPAAWPRSQSQNLPTRSPGGPIRPKVAGVESAGWTWLGPGNVGGRVRSILIHPTNPSTMWAGSVSGGVWKTTTAGASWFPLDDFMASLAVSCMVMDPANPNVIYAGTGEDGYVQGAGVFKTTDGGMSWTHLSSTASSSWYYVRQLAISPGNTQILLAATGSGIYRSADGGASWSQTYGSGASDLAFDPGNGGNCVASGAGFVFYSTDGGVTWTSATGIPGAGLIEIAYALGNANIVYASANNNNGEVYRSLDGGRTYSLRNTGNNYLSQGGYANCIWVDPTTPNALVVGGLDLWRSTDGGATLTRISDWRNARTSAHADQHVIVNHPNYNGANNRTVFFGNDGGVYCANDVYTASPGNGWTELNNNLGITQFWGAAGNATSGTIIGGAQDNGTVRYTTGGGAEGWTSMFGGDGGYCAADPTDAHFFYGEYIALQIYRSTNGGGSADYITSGLGDAGGNANFAAPFILDPNNPNTMLAGGASLWRSVNIKAATPTWSNITPNFGVGSLISAIAVAPGNSDIIWIGFNNGDVFATANGTASSPLWIIKSLGTPNLPNRQCSLAIDPNNWNQVFVTFGGFTSGNVWRTTDDGYTWTDLSNNLPNAPVYSLVIDPYDSSLLYVGTELGVFASVNGGASWSTSNDGPANVVVYHLSWVGDNLLAATFGRGCYLIQPIVWVQFGFGDPGIGTYARPFNTLAGGRDGVFPGGMILIKGPGTSPETMPMISKAMTIGAIGGSATIGK